MIRSRWKRGKRERERVGWDPLMPATFQQWICLSVGITERREKGNILAMKEATGIQFRGQKKGEEGEERMLSAWFAPKRRGFSLSKHLAEEFI